MYSSNNHPLLLILILVLLLLLLLLLIFILFLRLLLPFFQLTPVGARIVRISSLLQETVQ